MGSHILVLRTRLVNATYGAPHLKLMTGCSQIPISVNKSLLLPHQGRVMGIVRVKF